MSTPSNLCVIALRMVSGKEHGGEGTRRQQHQQLRIHRHPKAVDTYCINIGSSGVNSCSANAPNRPQCCVTIAQDPPARIAGAGKTPADCTQTA
jgi:hypothetical protein